MEREGCCRSAKLLGDLVLSSTCCGKLGSLRESSRIGLNYKATIFLQSVTELWNPRSLSFKTLSVRW